MQQPISKPVAAILLIGIGLTALILWFGPARRHTSADAVGTAAAILVTSGSGANSLSGLVPLPLGQILVEPENGMWLTDDDFLSVPRGTQLFGGIEFRLEGLLQ